MNQVNLYTGDVEAAPIGRQAQRRAEYWALYDQVEARILALCAERRMTPEDLQEAANCRLTTWGHRGAFNCDLKLSQLHRIAKALGVPLADLLG